MSRLGWHRRAAGWVPCPRQHPAGVPPAAAPRSEPGAGGSGETGCLRQRCFFRVALEQKDLFHQEKITQPDPSPRAFLINPSTGRLSRCVTSGKTTLLEPQFLHWSLIHSTFWLCCSFATELLLGTSSVPTGDQRRRPLGCPRGCRGTVRRRKALPPCSPRVPPKPGGLTSPVCTLARCKIIVCGLQNVKATRRIPRRWHPLPPLHPAAGPRCPLHRAAGNSLGRGGIRGTPATVGCHGGAGDLFAHLQPAGGWRTFVFHLLPFL